MFIKNLFFFKVLWEIFIGTLVSVAFKYFKNAFLEKKDFCHILCFSLISRKTVVSYWQKYEHLVLLNHLGRLIVPRNSVVRLTDSPSMTIDVYRRSKAHTHTHGYD